MVVITQLAHKLPHKDVHRLRMQLANCETVHQDDTGAMRIALSLSQN